MDIVADIGGTRTRLAMVDDTGAPGDPLVLRNDDFDGLEAVLRHFLDRNPGAGPLRGAAVAVAAPVTGKDVVMTNRDWHFNVDALRDALGLEFLTAVNDFTAVAMALPYLAPQDMLKIGGGEPTQGAAMAALGPGTGLGVSGLIPGPGGWNAIGGEGGHVTLAGVTPEEIAVIDRMRTRYSHCSAERLICGVGLVNLYEALLDVRGLPGKRPQPDEIGELAASGDTTAGDALETMFCLLGSVAGNLALTLGARGGVYLAGGILPEHRARFIDSGFRARFEDKGRYRAYLSAIPTYLLVARTPALTGLAASLRGLT